MQPRDSETEGSRTRSWVYRRRKQQWVAATFVLHLTDRPGLHEQCLKHPYTTQQHEIWDRRCRTGSIQSYWSVGSTKSVFFFQITKLPTLFWLDSSSMRRLWLRLYSCSVLFTSWLNRVGLIFHSFCTYSPELYSWRRLIPTPDVWQETKVQMFLSDQCEVNKDVH